VTALLLPILRVVRQAVPHIVEAIVGPAAAFLAGHAVWGLGGALLLAFLWTGTCLGLRIIRTGRASALLVIASVSLVLRTIVSVVAHSPRAFFLGPDVVTAGLGLLFLGSAFTAKPLAARVLGDLVPAHMLDLSNPRAARMCRIVSALWGTEQVLTAAVSIVLVFRFSPTQFITLHEPISMGVFAIVMGAALPFFWTDLRHLHRSHPLLGPLRPALAVPLPLGVA
jgi:hypothetical protein